MARLILGSEPAVAFQLGATTSVGREPSNAVQIVHASVSKQHCVLEQRGTTFVLRDPGSLNGTFVNGQRVTGERALADGDKIEFGRAPARFENSGAPPAVEPTASGARAAGPQAAGVEVLDQARQIGAQVSTANPGFQPFDQLKHDAERLRVSYEQLRMMAELTRAVAAERELAGLLDRVLLSLFQFVKANRGVILLRQDDGQLEVKAVRRREGSNLPISVSSTILNHAVRERAAVLTPDAMRQFGSGGKFDVAASVAVNRISSAIVVPLMHEDEVYGAVWLDSELRAQFNAQDLELVTGVANQAAMFIANTLLSRKIERDTRTRERLSRLLSPNVAELVIRGEVDVKQGGTHVPACTVFNSDIRGFTRMSEGTPPELMIDMLNEYFEKMVELVFRFEGTLDKFMGDGLMAQWGVPVGHADDPARAVRCALAMMEELAVFNRDRAKRSIFPFEVGIGIHTGPLVAGYVGSSKALSYTVIGDTANTSARLCGVAGSGQIIIAEATAAHLGSEFVLEELPAVQLKGKERPVRIFNVKR